MDPIRIWYQSYVDEPNGKIYWERLRRHLAAIVDPGTTVEVHGITPHDSYAHPIVEFRCAREVICNAVKAEREGYDAFILGHFQDAGLYEARSVVDIPVLALGEASMLHACQLGQRSGIVTINPRYISWFHHQIGKYGLERRVTGVHAMTFEPGQILKAYESEALAADVVRLFEEQGKPLVEAGCDVLIPGGGIPMLLFAAVSRPQRRGRAGDQRHSDRGQDGGGRGQAETVDRPLRQPRVGLRQSAAGGHRRVHDPSEGIVSFILPREAGKGARCTKSLARITASAVACATHSFHLPSTASPATRAGRPRSFRRGGNCRCRACRPRPWR